MCWDLVKITHCVPGPGDNESFCASMCSDSEPHGSKFMRAGPDDIASHSVSVTDKKGIPFVLGPGHNDTLCARHGDSDTLCAKTWRKLLTV